MPTANCFLFKIKLTASRTVYGKPQVGPFKYQCIAYGKPHWRVNPSVLFWMSSVKVYIAV
jgi:hypothetical protein